jgi:hypothetical protein
MRLWCTPQDINSYLRLLLCYWGVLIFDFLFPFLHFFLFLTYSFLSLFLCLSVCLPAYLPACMPDPHPNTHIAIYEGVSKSFRTESITKYTLTFGITRYCPLQRVIAAKLPRLTHKIAIQLHLGAESCNVCSSRSRRPVRKLLDTPSYMQGSFEKFVEWRQCAAVMQRETVSVMPSC